MNKNKKKREICSIKRGRSRSTKPCSLLSFIHWWVGEKERTTPASVLSTWYRRTEAKNTCSTLSKVLALFSGLESDDSCIILCSNSFNRQWDGENILLHQNKNTLSFTSLLMMMHVIHLQLVILSLFARVLLWSWSGCFSVWPHRTGRGDHQSSKSYAKVLNEKVSFFLVYFEESLLQLNHVLSSKRRHYWETYLPSHPSKPRKVYSFNQELILLTFSHIDWTALSQSSQT